MPEGPEVAIVADVISKGLDTFFYDGEIIENVSGKIHRFTNSPPSGWSLLQKGFTIRSVNTKGKLIWMDWELSDKNIIALSTLGMSGSWAWNKKNHKHTRLNFPAKTGEDLSFIDIRCFGTLRLIKQSQLNNVLSKIGWNLLTKPAPENNWMPLKNDLRIYNRPVGAALMDQRVISGLGNIYVNESLYQIGVSPEKLTSCIPDEKWKQLNEVAHNILKEAYKAGGSSVDSFEADGKKGEAQKFHKIYGKLTCPEGHKTSKTILDNRTKWFCSICQT